MSNQWKMAHGGRTRDRRPRGAAGGFTLIEVLVALLVLSFGLLGLASLMSKSLQANTGALLRTQASTYAYDILDRMRANRPAALNGAYTIAFDQNTSASDRTGEDLQAWKAELQELPQGDGEIAMSADTTVVTVRWRGPGALPAANARFATLSLKARL